MKILCVSARKALLLLLLCLFSFITSSSSVVIRWPKFIKKWVYKVRPKEVAPSSVSSPLSEESKPYSKGKEDKSLRFPLEKEGNDDSSKSKGNNDESILLLNLANVFGNIDQESKYVKSLRDEEDNASVFYNDKILFSGLIEDLSLEKYIEIGWMDIDFLLNHLSEIGEKNIIVGAWRTIQDFTPNINDKININRNNEKTFTTKVAPDTQIFNSKTHNPFQKMFSSIKKKLTLTKSKPEHEGKCSPMESEDHQTQNCKSVLHFLSERTIKSEHPVKLSVPGIKVNPYVESEKFQRMVLATSFFEDEENKNKSIDKGGLSFHDISRKDVKKTRMGNTEMKSLTSFTVIEVNQVKNIPYAENYDVITVVRAVWMNDSMSNVANLKKLKQLFQLKTKQKEKECKTEQKKKVYFEITQKVRIKRKFILESLVQKAAFEEAKFTMNLWANSLLSQLNSKSIEVPGLSRHVLRQYFPFSETYYRVLNKHNILFLLLCVARNDIVTPVSTLSSEENYRPYSTPTSTSTSDKARNESKENIASSIIGTSKYVAIAALGVITGIVSITFLPRFLGYLPFGTES